MVSFNKLAKNRKSAESVRYEFYGVNADGTASILIVAPATQANKPYTNAFLKKSAAITRRARSMTAVTVEQLDAIREIDRELYAQHVVRGWENVHDDSGEPVPFNTDNCKALLDAIPAEDLDELRNFCGNSHNFTDIDSEGAAKN